MNTKVLAEVKEHWDVLNKVDARWLEGKSAGIGITDERIRHCRDTDKVARGAAVSLDSLLMLPEILANPSAILLDRRDSAIIYVHNPGTGSKREKFVVRIGINTKVAKQEKRTRRLMNKVTSAGIIDVSELEELFGEGHALKGQKVYKLIDGAL